MAGKPGKSGGARPGAGRKPKSKSPVNQKAVRETLESQPHGGALKRSNAEPVPIEGSDTLKLLQDIAFGRVDASNIQVRAAIAAVQYTHTKKGDGGVKDGKQEAAKKAGAGKFAAPAPPKLVISNK